MYRIERGAAPRRSAPGSPLSLKPLSSTTQHAAPLLPTPEAVRARVHRKRPKQPSRHGHAHTHSHGRECSHHSPARPAPKSCEPTRTTETADRNGLRMFGSPRADLQKEDHQATPRRSSGATCERCAIEEQPACGSEYVAPWVEMERPSQPKVAHMDAIQRQLRRKRARDPRGSPVVSTREPRHLRLPNAPSTVSDGEKQRHQPLQWADSNRPGRQPPAHHGVAIRAPPFPPRRPETTRAAVVSPNPHVTQCGPQRTFWVWCQPRPTRYRYNA